MQELPVAGFKPWTLRMSEKTHRLRRVADEMRTEAQSPNLERFILLLFCCRNNKKQYFLGTQLCTDSALSILVKIKILILSWVLQLIPN